MTALAGPDVIRLGAKALGGTQTTPAFRDAMECTVVSATLTQVTFTVDGFDATGQSTFTGDYEPRFTWTGGTKAQITPPAGTACLAVWPSNSPSGSPTVVAFSGWPS